EIFRSCAWVFVLPKDIKTRIRKRTFFVVTAMEYPRFNKMHEMINKLSVFKNLIKHSSLNG
ncbi:MAG: hypothetical protein ABIN74_13130, partial [Ferruginibacter sp.]